MRHSYASSIAWTIVLSAAGGFALADDAKSDAPVTPAAFVTHAAQAGMTEVELGKIALNQSQDQSVRKFADRMVKDHGKANMELTALAKRKNLEVPQALDAKHRKIVDELGKKSGAAFDAAYADHMVTAHEKAVSLFQKASDLSDADLAGFAQKTLPTVKEHKRMAEALHAGKHSAAAEKADKSSYNK